MITGVSAKVIAAANAIFELYQTFDGGAGGYGHIVFDDENFDCVAPCLKDAKNNIYDLSEETRQASIKALELCNELTEDEVAMAVYLKRMYEDSDS